MGFEVTDKNLKRAGLDYWDKLNITYYDNLAQFMDMHGNAPLCLFSTKARQTYTDTHYEDGVFLMFGREDRGLPETLLRERYDSTVRIPMRDTLRSLNLSNSVAIACYEVLRQWDFPGLERAGELSEQVQ
jgi:tRNA (cytidine/uridine-2'-O-)-methyltransferase